MLPDSDTRLRFVAIALTFVICGLLWSLVQAIRPPAPWTPTPTLAPPPVPSATPTASPTATVPPEPTERPTVHVSPTVHITNIPAPTATHTATPVPYRSVQVLRHDAMESVFYWFPERRDLRADAFIAMYDCANIGRWFWLRLPDGFQYRVVVTDCMQEKHRAAHRAKWGDVEVIELDGAFWRARGLTLRGGVMAEIANLPNPFP